MNSKKMDKLIIASYKGDKLDQANVNKIVSLISKADLKRYINKLKIEEKKKNLIISSPIDCNDIKKFQKMFPNKKIIFKKDPSLMLGIKIIDNDTIYDFTLKNTFEKIINHIEQNYD
jgi:hypothetical protein